MAEHKDIQHENKIPSYYRVIGINMMAYQFQRSPFKMWMEDARNVEGGWMECGG